MLYREKSYNILLPEIVIHSPLPDQLGTVGVEVGVFGKKPRVDISINLRTTTLSFKQNSL